MADDSLAVIAEGDEISAKWLNKLRWIVWRNRITVARDCGLTLTPGFFGKVIGLAPSPSAMLGITTTTLPARAAKVVHYGTVQPYVLNGDTLTLAGPTVQVGNWTGGIIPTNVWIKYTIMYKQNIFDGYDCSGVAP